MHCYIINPKENVKYTWEFVAYLDIDYEGDKDGWKLLTVNTVTLFVLDI